MSNKKLTFIDLFAGCGGLTEGFLQSGHYEALAHVEWELPMVKTLRHRLVQKWQHSEEEAEKRVVRFDVQKTEELLHGKWSELSIEQYGKNNHKDFINNGLRGIIGNSTVDLIIGGPPCQAYSIAGRAQDPHSMKLDYRNYLFESFVKIVDYFKPKVFVFENVPGLLTACPGDKPVRNRIYDAFNDIGYEIRTPEKLKLSVFCSEDFSVPQKRNRIIIFGVQKGKEIILEELYESLLNLKQEKKLTVYDAIGNMPRLVPLEKPIKVGRGNVSHYQPNGDKINLHTPRYHSPRDLKLFYEWLSKNMNYYSQEDKKAFYTKVTGKLSNHIKYRNIEWDKPSPTVVAHLYKDGYMFIHPDIEQLRSITIREAALLQSFPIDFEFPASNPYCFKMIGNAVPVNFAKAIAEATFQVFNKINK